jgi:hypothetical protein
MKLQLALCLALVMPSAFSARVVAAEVDARPPDRLIASASGSTQTGSIHGGEGSLNWLHYFTPDALFGIGADHQFISDARLTIGSLRGSSGWGDPASRFVVYGEINYGTGDDNGRNFDYAVAALGFSQAVTRGLSFQLEGRQIDIDRTHGNLPKLGITYLWSRRLLTSAGYAHSVGGNLGTKLFTARLDYYGPYVNFIAGGASGRANPSVLVLQPDQTVPAQTSKEGFIGVGKTFSRGELQLLGDYLKLAESKKVTVTLSFTAYLGSRGRVK